MRRLLAVAGHAKEEMVSQTCVCTVSLARDEREARLIHGTLEQLSHAGIPVVVADGGSPPDFVDAISALPHVSVVIPQQSGLVGQVQAAFAAARVRQAPFVLYLESDKALFAQQHLAGFLERACTDADVGAVLAGRSGRSFATFPALQRSTEARINEMTGTMIGRAGDYSYGPFLLNVRLVSNVDRLRPSLGWGWRHFMFGIAHRLGYRLMHVTGDYDCPMEQREEGEHERQHRERQLEQNIEGLRLSVTEQL
jgi:Glycosyl transferase family 2